MRAVVATAYILDGSEDRRDEAVEILREGIEIGHDQEWSVRRDVALPHRILIGPLRSASLSSRTSTSPSPSHRIPKLSSPLLPRPPSLPTLSSPSSSSPRRHSSPVRPPSTKKRTTFLRKSNPCKAVEERRSSTGSVRVRQHSEDGTKLLPPSAKQKNSFVESLCFPFRTLIRSLDRTLPTRRRSPTSSPLRCIQARRLPSLTQPTRSFRPLAPLIPVAHHLCILQEAETC